MNKLELKITIAEDDHSRFIDILDNNDLGYWLSPVLPQDDCSKPLELLQSIAEEQGKLMQPGMAEFQIKAAFKNLKALDTVKKLLEEHDINGRNEQLPPDWYAVYSGSEKLDLGDKKPIAFVMFEEHAKELIKKYLSFGYYEKLTNKALNNLQK